MRELFFVIYLKYQVKSRLLANHIYYFKREYLLKIHIKAILQNRTFQKGCRIALFSGIKEDFPEIFPKRAILQKMGYE